MDAPPVADLEGMIRAGKFRGAAYAAILLWVNAYICRDWFFHLTAQMNSLHGYWAAIARLGSGWLHPSWWPYWDLGIPFEYTSAPLVPAMATMMRIEAVSAIFYCAAPLALFAAAWQLTHAPEYSFLAGLFYSMLSPGQILAPDGAFHWADFLSPHHFMLQAVWDETPRCAALTFLLLFLVFLVRSSLVAAAVSLALAMLASPFTAISGVIAAACLLTALPAEKRRDNLLRAAGVGLLAFALAARYLPPSLWMKMAQASADHEAWNLGVLKIYAAIAVVWLTLVHFRAPFFVLLAFAMSCGPILGRWLDRIVLPQASRFRIEMEAAIALLVVFGLRPLLERLPRPGKAALAVALLWFGGQQVIHHRRVAKDVLHPADVTKTIEYRTAQRVAREMPGARVLLPGSIARWANAFTAVSQFGGSEGTMAYSQIQQRAMTAIYEDDARAALSWLKAFGTAAVVVSDSSSRETWKPFANPDKFHGALPELWSENGVTAYRIPQRSSSLAHVVPETALANIDRYNAALDDPSLPEASFEWLGNNHIRIHAVTLPGQAVSIQVSHHPGWRAAVPIHRDPRGLMWLRPAIPGHTTMDLDYDGGWELRLCGWLSLTAGLAAAFFLVRGAFR